MRPLAFALALTLAGTLAVRGQAPVEPLFDTFFAAETPADAQTAAEKLVAAGADFDRTYARLKQGRFYGDEKRGEYSLRWKSKSGPYFNNVVEVPSDYDPAKPMPAHASCDAGGGNHGSHAGHGG